MPVVSEEITRLQGAKADLKTAIEAKGVTVPSAALLDDYADYVDAIQQGSAPSLQSKSVSPSTSQQTVHTVTVAAVTAAIDADIVAGNIKKDVNILGVVGTYEGSGGGSTLTPTAGDYPVVGDGNLGGGGSALTSTGVSVTIPVTGTYRFKWCAFRRNNSTSYTWSSRLYRTRSGQTTAIGTENSTWTSTYIQENSQDIACSAGDVITVYVKGRSSTYSWGGMLTACVAQKLWTN